MKAGVLGARGFPMMPFTGCLHKIYVGRIVHLRFDMSGRPLLGHTQRLGAIMDEQDYNAWGGRRDPFGE
jgi:hypothetical protein